MAGGLPRMIRMRLLAHTEFVVGNPVGIAANTAGSLRTICAWRSCHAAHRWSRRR